MSEQHVIPPSEWPGNPPPLAEIAKTVNRLSYEMEFLEPWYAKLMDDALDPDPRKIRCADDPYFEDDDTPHESLLASAYYLEQAVARLRALARHLKSHRSLLRLQERMEEHWEGFEQRATASAE